MTYDNVWLVDFEFRQPQGERPTVICGVYHNVQSGETLKYWQDSMQPPPLGRNDCMVAYYASAEVSVFLAEGWQLPNHIVDFYAEFSTLHNGYTPFGRGLTGALSHYGLSHIAVDEKEALRGLAIRGIIRSAKAHPLSHGNLWRVPQRSVG